MLRHFKNNSAFTLVELLITISILTVIITTVVLNQSAYTDSLAVSNLADEISSMVSQAQVYSTSVRGIAPGTSDFTSAFGLSFSVISPPEAIMYIYFADLDGDGFYSGDATCAGGGECLEKFNISGGNYLDSICAVLPAGAENCSIGRVDISFKRPSTKANFIFLNHSGEHIIPLNSQGARIRLKSPAELDRSVVVYSTGQISVTNNTESSCTGTYLCSQWTGYSEAICEGNGHECVWNSIQSKCIGSITPPPSCNALNFPQCSATPNNCLWQ